MIDRVGKGGAGRIDLGRQEKGAAVEAPQGQSPRAAASGVRSEVLELISRRAPVDASRVETLRAAIQGGLYPIEPNLIARRMLDADLPRRG